MPSCRPLHTCLLRPPPLLLLSLTLPLSALSLTLLVLAALASTSPTTPYYFLRLDFRHALPASAPNADQIQRIANQIGLQDFYQLGLWGYCSGLFPTASPAGNAKTAEITFCSAPSLLFWPNPLEILSRDLLRGATLVVPASLERALGVLRTVSTVNANLYIAAGALGFLAGVAWALAVGVGFYFSRRRRRSVGDGSTSSVGGTPPGQSTMNYFVRLAFFLSLLAAGITTGAASLSTAVFVGGARALRGNGGLEVRGGVGAAVGLVWGSVAVEWVVLGAGWWAWWRVRSGMEGGAEGVDWGSENGEEEGDMEKDRGKRRSMEVSRAWGI